MANQSLMWTALPNGLDEDGSLRISALLSPRLTPDADQILKPFQDLIDWPATLRASKFIVHFGAQSATVAGDAVDGAVDVPDSDTWQALFPETTFVAGYVAENHVNDKVLSYDTVAVHSVAQGLYTSLGRQPGDALPKVSQILKDAGWQSLVNAVAHIDRSAADDTTGLRNPARQMAEFRNNALNVTDPVANALLHAQLFHTPPSKPSIQDYSGAPIDAKDPRRDAKWLTYERATLPAKEDFVKRIDFHQIVAAMNQYPRLLRRLGLVIDLVIPRGTFADTANQQLWVECSLGTEAAGVTRANASSRTRTRLGGGKFEALPRPAWKPGDYRVRDGLLQINPDLYAVLQTDVDAAALKLMNFARTLRKLQSQPELQADAVTKHEKESGVPALRNAGFMLVHRRRAMLLTNAFADTQAKHNAIANSFANPAAAGPDLFAEDLIRGWRIDIWDRNTGKWRSLCERSATYTVGGALTVEDSAEGIVRLAATKAADGNNGDVVYLHEALVSWTGWSLVAQQPGRAVDKDDTSSDPTVEVPPGLNLSSVFAARPGSLPRLRYGRRYWIRARMTDLAANSLAPTEKTISTEEPDKNNVLYTRFEPVQAPAIALLRDAGDVEKPLEGESMERLAIRTLNGTPDKNTIPTDASARRFAAPARSNVKEAELHGMLDGAGAVDGSASMYDLLAKKDAALEEVKLITAGPLTDPGATVETSYSVLDAGAAEIPYLPDPLCTAISARIFDLPGFPNTTVISIPAYSGASWPLAAPFTIRIFEDAGQAPHFEEDTRILQIPLPKAVRATLRLSSQLDTDALALMGIWNWLPAADRTTLAPSARNGQHWMLTPWRNIELVHATQKPLISPAMKLVVQRIFGETRAGIRFGATCSIDSTARVDLQGQWHEPDFDSDTEPVGTDRARSDHAFSVKITDPRTYATHNLDPNATGIADHDILGPDLIGVGQSRRSPAKYHEYNDTRYRRVEYWLEATTRFREFMPSSILTKDDGGSIVPTDENIKVSGEPVVAWVPNSSPPPAPQVLYVVPTFGWTSTKNAQGVETHWRRGGGLRVYLDRPWNATGYGEMLAVVLPRASFTADPNTAPAAGPLKKFVTQWGNDPIWASNFVAGPAPKASDFPLARTAPDATGAWLPPFAPPQEADQAPGAFSVTGLPHPSIATSLDANQFVDIAPHDVAYDAERRLWYADLEIRFGSSYNPFIRLALARYQPTSVQGAHLSNIVQADFMNLAPDRWLSVSQGQTTDMRNVSVFGYTYSDSSGSREASAAVATPAGNTRETPVSVARSSVVELWVEKLNPAMGEDFGWQRESAAVVTAISPAVPNPTFNHIRTQSDIHLRALHAEFTAKRKFEDLADILQTNPTLFWPRMWEGMIALPAGHPADARYRLAIAEFEEYIVDDATPYNETPSAKDRRLVFLQFVDLT